MRSTFFLRFVIINRIYYYWILYLAVPTGENFAGNCETTGKHGTWVYLFFLLQPTRLKIIKAIMLMTLYRSHLIFMRSQKNKIITIVDPYSKKSTGRSGRQRAAGIVKYFLCRWIGQCFIKIYTLFKILIILILTRWFIMALLPTAHQQFVRCLNTYNLTQ